VSRQQYVLKYTVHSRRAKGSVFLPITIFHFHTFFPYLCVFLGSCFVPIFLLRHNKIHATGPGSIWYDVGVSGELDLSFFSMEEYEAVRFPKISTSAYLPKYKASYRRRKSSVIELFVLSTKYY
jgi:hypothetical protein